MNTRAHLVVAALVASLGVGTLPILSHASAIDRVAQAAPRPRPEPLPLPPTPHPIPEPRPGPNPPPPPPPPTT